MRLILRRPDVSRVLPQQHKHVRFIKSTSIQSSERLQLAARQYRSDLWIPKATLSQQNEAAPDAGQLLIRAGYLRQAYSGIFHMLPLGLRVQNKLEALIDKHMRSLRASKVSLSSISSQGLWKKSGRLQNGSEFLKFKDRKGAEWLLAPTHEEEITGLVRDTVHSPSHLPARLYQITRKYRDEKRPRGGLLRGREFIMKDLYTFDKTEAEAHATYADVREAYRNLFDELKLPYIEARADSGNMGGSLSHEFHFPSNLGEDDLITCTSCDYAKNEEFVPDLTTTRVEIPTTSATASPSSLQEQPNVITASFLSKNRKTLVKAFARTRDKSSISSLNPFVVKKCLEGKVEIDTGIEDVSKAFNASLASEDATKLRVYYLFDQSASPEVIQAQVNQDADWLKQHKLGASAIRIEDEKTSQSHLLKKETGDQCPECTASNRDGTLKVTKAIEVGHTFHLGDRYSSKLDFKVPVPSAKQIAPSYVSMGCHGIGVSRLIAAAASALSDSNGLIWPRAIAPYEVLILLPSKDKESVSMEVANQLYDNLIGDSTSSADVLIDDREVNFGWKIKDADLIGYPVVIIIGKSWFERGTVEIQCRRLKLKEEVKLDAAPLRIRELLEQL